MKKMMKEAIESRLAYLDIVKKELHYSLYNFEVGLEKISKIVEEIKEMVEEDEKQKANV